MCLRRKILPSMHLLLLMSAPELNIWPVLEIVSGSRHFVLVTRNSCRSSVYDILLKFTFENESYRSHMKLCRTVTADRRLFYALWCSYIFQCIFVPQCAITWYKIRHTFSNVYLCHNVDTFTNVPQCAITWHKIWHTFNNAYYSALGTFCTC